ncbi:MAG: Hint domain-containing protein [Rhodospirillales bacterium]|nr:Hint domain-containing protein [Rhodospirillales bacterium]
MTAGSERHTGLRDNGSAFADLTPGSELSGPGAIPLDPSLDSNPLLLPVSPGSIPPAPAPRTGVQDATGPITSTVGTTGDTAMNAPTARSTYGVSGAGVKIGILSDSFATTSGAATALATEEADGDLPSTVTVLSDYSGGADEGRAMAELVHQVAPGAQLYFATAFGSEAAFANNILALAAAGCKVIVDDVTYLSEPFFQDGGIIAAAVEKVISEGVSYFTAASNEGSNFYEAAVNPTSGKLPGGGTNLKLQNFGASAAAASGSSTLQQITVAAGVTIQISLQWTQPFASISGTGTAYGVTLYLYGSNGNQLTRSGASPGSDPVDTVSYTNSSGGSVAIDLAISYSGTVASGDVLKYIVYDGGTVANATINDSAAGIGSGSVIGHEVVATANTVGAINSTNLSAAESFSSVGPGLTYYTATGTRLATPISSNKVNFLAPDGVTTSVTGFGTFFGTSAAAPDAAAVGALMQQANSNLTPAEISAYLEQTATSIAGSVTLTGAGLVNGNAAVAAAYGIAWAQASGGVWSDAAGWAGGAVPTALNPVTLADDQGTLTAAYTVTVDIATAAAMTLSVGILGAVPATLDIATGAMLAIGGGVTIGGFGSVVVGGTLAIGGGLSGGTLTLQAGSVLDVTTSAAATLVGGLTTTLVLGGGGQTLIDFIGLAYNAADTVTFASGTDLLSLTNGGTVLSTLQLAAPTVPFVFTTGHDSSGHEVVTIACYCPGTRIATPDGEVPVEKLAIGDIVLTAAGRPRPVRWIGRRSYTAGQIAAQRGLLPIRIRAGAIAPRRPRRDLLVSPEHALLLDDEGARVLVPAGRLVNGVSIRRDPAGAGVAYIHVELDSHDAILAEGQAAETYLAQPLAHPMAAGSSRATFANAAEYAALYPNATPGGEFCAPRVEGGAVLARIRARLDAQAGFAPGPLDGHVDRADHVVIGGWAHDAGNPASPVLLEILVDGEPGGTVLAEQPRADLVGLDRGGGFCGFALPLRAPLDPDRAHLVSVRRAADGAELRGSPVLIDRATDRATTRVEALLDQLADTRESEAAGVAAILMRQIDRLRGLRAPDHH